MINRRGFLKSLIGTSIGTGISLYGGAALASKESPGNTADNVIVIDGRKYIGAPTYTPKEANAAFASAIAEWPSVRAVLNRIAEKIAELDAVDEHRMWVEKGYLSDAISILYAEWEKRHGIVCTYRDHQSKLLAWTKEGEIIGPPYDFDDSEESNCSQVVNGVISTYRNHESKLDAWDETWTKDGEVIKVGGEVYYIAPIYSPKKAQAVLKAVLAELPKLKEMRAKVDNTIKQLEDFGGLRMQSEIALLNCEFSRLEGEFERKHGVVQTFSPDDIEFHLAVCTKNGIVAVPVLTY